MLIYMYILACILVNPKLQDLHIMFLYGTVLVGLESNDLSESFPMISSSNIFEGKRGTKMTNTSDSKLIDY